jgi:signal transduction histidine kinase
MNFKRHRFSRLSVTRQKWELRPSVLDDLGLIAAMKKFVEGWSAHFSIPAEFKEIGLDGKHLLPEIEINFIE